MTQHQPGTIRTALSLLGEHLAAEGASYSIVVVGGAALNLLGVVNRTTRDVDVLAMQSGLGTIVPPPSPLPIVFLDGVKRVAEDMSLDADWLNTEIAVQWTQGLPPGLEK